VTGVQTCALPIYHLNFMQIRITESWPAGRTIGLSISLSLDDREILIHFLLHGISIKL